MLYFQVKQIRNPLNSVTKLIRGINISEDLRIPEMEQRSLNVGADDVLY